MTDYRYYPKTKSSPKISHEDIAVGVEKFLTSGGAITALPGCPMTATRKVWARPSTREVVEP